MSDMSDLFDTPKGSGTKIGMALILRMLASMLDEKESSEDSEAEEKEPELLTRPHFFPSGG